MPIIGPYALSGDVSDTNKDRGDDEKVPVGSLRFLRNQAEMESDMNTRRVLAGREMTGDSGIFSEVRLIVDAAANTSRTLDLNQRIFYINARFAGQAGIPSLRLS
jgi:hypothetical protein